MAIFAMACCLLVSTTAKASMVSAGWKVTAWSGGYTATLTITNTGATPITGWSASFQTPQKETSVWNATISGPVANTYTLTPANWNSTIAKNGGSVSIGFTFNGAPPVIPTHFLFNGQPVTLNAPSGGVSPTPTPTVTPTPTPAPTATPIITPTPTPAGGNTTVTILFPQATVKFSETSDWESGFNAQVSIMNNSAETLTNWSLSFQMAPVISTIWNASIASQSGTTYTINAASTPWNNSIAPGASVSFGFTAAPSLHGVAPTEFVFSASAPGSPQPTPTATPTPTPSATPEPTVTPVPTPTATPTPLSRSSHHLTGYFPSWSDSYYYYAGYNGVPMTDAQLLAASMLAKTSTTPYSDIYLAFAQPDFSWSGITNNTWSGTGLNFSSAPKDVAQAIRLLHNSGQRVVLSVGGATYLNWNALAADAGRPIGTTAAPIKTALAQFLVDMKIDGLDVDYEINGVSPLIITQYAQAIQTMREAVDAAAMSDGRARVLALAGWSTGADFSEAALNPLNPNEVSYWGGSAGRERLALAAQVNTGAYAGKQVGILLNIVNIMSYDAGCQYYDPAVAYDEYRQLLPASVSVSAGFEIPPESWGGAVLVIRNADAGQSGTVVLDDQYRNVLNVPYSVERIGSHVLANTINANANDGLMVWNLLLTQTSQVTTSSGGTATTASPATIAAEAVSLFGKTNNP